jgi:ubiquitin carboxyl-terminal hydrolase 4/11/15
MVNAYSSDNSSTSEDQQVNVELEKLKAEQKNIIKELYKLDRLVEGKNYFLVSARWWIDWKNYVYFDYNTNFPHDHPGKIDNRHLLDNNDKVKRGLHEKYDYMIFGVDIWKKLVEWYGGGPLISKLCVRSKYGGLSVEVRQMEVKLYISNQLNNKIEINCSKAIKVGEFMIFIVNRMQLDPSKIRMWDFYSNEKRNVLKNMFFLG